MKQLKDFGFVVPEISFGNGAVNQVGERIKQLGASKVMIITDEGLVKAGLTAKLSSILEESNIQFEIFDKVEMEPSLENIEMAYQKASQNDYELLIGFGGGSSMDVTKLVAVLLRYGGPVKQYLGINNIPGRGVPTILIPTTSGTGSEVSKYGIFDDREAKTKKGAVSLHLVTDLAVVDPEMTVSMPPHVTASSGADAFIHAVEGYLAVNATPITDVFALEAIKIIFESLPAAFADGENLNARYNMSYGSMLAGIVLNNAGVSSSHALAYPIGSEYHVPHGVGCMLTFLEVMNYFAMASLPKFVEMAHAMGIQTDGLSPREAAEQAVAEMRKLAEYIEIPHKLSHIDMDQDLIEPFAKSVVANQQRLLTNGPRKFSEKDIKAIYQCSF